MGRQNYADGRDIRTLNMEELRKNIALVLQDTHLLRGTVMENIRYGRSLMHLMRRL